MIDDDDALARRRRAEARRAAWPDGEVVPAGTPKPVLYAGMTAEERLGHMWSLCKAQWLASGRELPRIPRAELPGEVFVIRRAGT
jgi:hypothetical protein